MSQEPEMPDHGPPALAAIDGRYWVVAGFAIAAIELLAVDQWLLATRTTTVDYAIRADADAPPVEVSLPGPDLFLPMTICVLTAIAILRFRRHDLPAVAGAIGVVAAVGLMSMAAPYSWLGLLPATLGGVGVYFCVRAMRPPVELDHDGNPLEGGRRDADVGL